MYIYIYGGFEANNPSGIAVVEGITKCGWQKEQIKLLSIGCTHLPYYVDAVGATKKGFNIIRSDKMLNTFMEVESQYSEGMTKLLLDSSRYLKINHEQPDTRFEMDNASSERINELIGIGKSVARYECKKVISSFFDKKAELFTPVYKL